MHAGITLFAKKNTNVLVGINIATFRFDYGIFGGPFSTNYVKIREISYMPKMEMQFKFKNKKGKFLLGFDYGPFSIVDNSTYYDWYTNRTIGSGFYEVVQTYFGISKVLNAKNHDQCLSFIIGSLSGKYYGLRHSSNISALFFCKVGYSIGLKKVKLTND